MRMLLLLMRTVLILVNLTILIAITERDKHYLLLHALRKRLQLTNRLFILTNFILIHSSTTIKGSSLNILPGKPTQRRSRLVCNGNPKREICMDSLLL